MMRLPDSKALMYTVCGASLACAVILSAAYGFDGELREKGTVPMPAAAMLSIAPTSIAARAAVVYDPITKQILFAKNADMQWPLASLTKLMTADTVLSLSSENTVVTITPEDLKPDGDWGFKPGEQWSLHDLLTFGLVVSSNDAMAAAANAAPGDVISAMNHRAQELGLTQTYFSNPTGLDVDLETAGAYGSAHDVAVLAATFLAEHPALFEATTASSMTITSKEGDIVYAKSTDVPLLNIPGLIGAKTGYTDLAGGNLVAAFDLGINHPLIVVVLGSTVDGRFTDMQTLIAATRAELSQ